MSSTSEAAASTGSGGLMLPPLALHRMGFCGADDSIPVEMLLLLSSKYSYVEWGFLFRDDKIGEPRYASMEYVRKLCKLNAALPEGQKLHLAGHLCGNKCQEILSGDTAFAAMLARMGFERVQVNATAANDVRVDVANLSGVADNILSCIHGVPTLERIFQYNEETTPIFQAMQQQVHAKGETLPGNMSVLVDASCGKGVEASTYPPPMANVKMTGYAGGIGPHNVQEVLRQVHLATSGVQTWIDMESKIRVKVVNEEASGAGAGGMMTVPAVIDEFSFKKCFLCCQRYESMRVESWREKWRTTYHKYDVGAACGGLDEGRMSILLTAEFNGGIAPPSADQLFVAMCVMDKNRDGFVSEEEFVDSMLELPAAISRHEARKATFRYVLRCM